MTSFPIKSWHQKTWQQLIKIKLSNKLGHALLFCGPKGIGKLEVANEFAKVLLCNKPNNEEMCKECQNCYFLKANTHPDLFLIQPEDNSRTIKIEQIRSLSADLSKTAQQGGYKIAILNPAESMNLYAVNALLKTLEEPTENTLLILVSSNPQSLPATIRSRCQQIIFSCPDRRVVREWLLEQDSTSITHDNIDLLLSLAMNAPLLALTLADKKDSFLEQEKLFTNLMQFRNEKSNILFLAARYINEDLFLLCQHLLLITSDLVKIKFGVNKQCVIVIDPLQQELAKKLLQSLNYDRLFYYFDRLLQLEKQLLEGINLNKQLVVEDIFLDFCKL